ncbi:MAG: type II secretion system minor pseudopilin GspJ, partial [Prosthecobacter sp.]|nr:type II secretion system minor pseudopilin GspJ [Prosthecobacter sp.]
MTAGFTLIEILVALMVFAILAAITSSTMYYAFNTRSRVTEQAEQIVTMELALTLFGRDTAQTVTRAVRGNEMRLFPIFTGQSTYLELTRGGFVNPGSVEKRSTLQRVAWLCLNKRLIRRTWNSLDTPNRNSYEDTVILNDLKACQFAYIDKLSQVLDEWRGGQIEQGMSSEPLPKAIRLTLSLQHWGNASLLFLLPG